MAAVKKSVAVLLILLIGLVAGCASNASPSNEPPTEQAKTTDSQTVAPEGTSAAQQPSATQGMMHITVYFATDDGMYVAPEVNSVPKNDHPAQTAVELLLAGPKNHDLVSVIPAETKVKHVWVKDRVAYVDFTDKLVKNNNGGSTMEMLLVASIVNTLTEFSDIQKVQILVDGKKIDTISGHMDVSEPLTRFEKLVKK